jgi:hypothetical protein
MKMSSPSHEGRVIPTKILSILDKTPETQAMGKNNFSTENADGGRYGSLYKGTIPLQSEDEAYIASPALLEKKGDGGKKFVYVKDTYKKIFLLV